MARELLAAHQAGRVEVAIGRASDYFGPRGGAQSNLGDRVFTAALTGKTASVLGDLDQPHTYSYIPDIGEGLAVLGEHPDAPGEVWHLPNDPDTRTTRQLVDIVYRHAGRPAHEVRSLPPLMLRGIGLFNATVRELLEMQYQFEEPFVVDSSKIATKLGVQATPYDQALADTLATYRDDQSARQPPRPAATSPQQSSEGSTMSTRAPGPTVADAMVGRTVLVTGGSGGIGKATALGLAAMGARVAITGRDPARTDAAAREIRAAHGGEVMAFVADLSSQAEVRRLADEVQRALPRIDVLVNNVGGYWNTRRVTVDGLEHTFALNHLAPFLLTSLLLGRLNRSAPARVVTVASNAQAQGRIDFDDLQGERSYSGARAYNQSKLANVLFTYELARRLGNDRCHGQRAAPRSGEHLLRRRRPRRRTAVARPVPAAVHEVPVPRGRHLHLPGIIARSRRVTGRYFANAQPSGPRRSATTRRSQTGCGG